MNTDAIDNSAGVDCSDHEVNIKIFLDRMIAAGRMSAGERPAFLHSLQAEVGRLVIRTNDDQNALLLNDKQLAVEWSPPSFERTMDWLESVTDLDRGLEFLPSNEELQARVLTGKGLTTPELAVLAAYAKIELARELTEAASPTILGSRRHSATTSPPNRFRNGSASISPRIRSAGKS